MPIDPLLSRFGVTLADKAASNTGPTGSTGNANTASATPNNQFTEGSFMTLLTTELQAQDPTNPLDPNQFVAQLVQFNMLDQLAQIHALLAASGSSQAQAGAPSSANTGTAASGAHQ